MREVLRHTWNILEKPERSRFLKLIALDVVISILDILSLALLLWIVQFYIDPGSINRYSALLPAWLANKSSVWFIAIFFLLFGIKNLAAFLVARAYFSFIGEVAVRISANNLNNYQQAGYEEFVHTDSSVHIRRISYQPFEFGQYILTGIQQLVTQGCLIAIAIIAILAFNAKLFLLLLVMLLPPVIAVFYLLKKKLSAARKGIQVNNEKSFQYLFDALKGYVEGNIYDRNSFFLNRFVNARKKFSRALFDSMAIQYMPGRIIEIFAILGLFILIAIATWTNPGDAGTLLTVGAFMAAAYKIIPGIVKIINTSGQMKAYGFTAMELARQIKNNNATPAQDKVIRSIELENIDFSYNGQPVLEDVSLYLKAGDFLGISGQSGKGKTTLLHVMLGFLSPNNGSILVNETLVKDEEIHSWWPGIAYVRQQSFFIHDTLLRNITLQEKVYDAARLQYAIEASGLEPFIQQSPEGLEKMIMENGKNISGGQQQRIALARAFYKDARLLLLDEPFNELDEESEQMILEQLQELAANGRMIILITHSKKSLAYCTKTFSLDAQHA